MTRQKTQQNHVSQRSLHNAPIFRLLLKVAVNGTHQCDFINFCGQQCPTFSKKGSLKGTCALHVQCTAFSWRLLWMGRINVASSIFADSNVQHSTRKAVLKWRAFCTSTAPSPSTVWDASIWFHQFWRNSNVQLNKKSSLKSMRSARPQLHSCMEAKWLLGRSPHKNYKNDLDDQTWQELE